MPIEVYRNPAAEVVAGFIDDPSINFLLATQPGKGKWQVAGQELNGSTSRSARLQFAVRSEDIRPAESGLAATAKLVEPCGAYLWATSEVDGDMSVRSGRGQCDGPTEITDIDRTGSNRTRVVGFIVTCLIGRDLARVPEFIDAERYVAHHADRGDGLQPFLDLFGGADGPLAYQECFIAVAEGNFAATLNRATPRHAGPAEPLPGGPVSHRGRQDRGALGQCRTRAAAGGMGELRQVLITTVLGAKPDAAA